MYEKPTGVVGQRVGAFLIDGLILFAFSAIIFFLMADTQEDVLRKIGNGDLSITDNTYINANIGDKEYSIVGGGKFFLYLLIVHGFAFAYMGVFQGIKGFTLGKLALGIRTVDGTGQPPGAGRGILRWLFLGFLPVDSFFFYVVGLVTMLSTQSNQRVGDLIAKTYVVKQKFLGQSPTAPAGAGGGYGAPQAGGFAQRPQVQPPQPVAAGGGGSEQKADWYPDPQGQARLRYWDGQNWTDHTSD
jgi:uncharacterized RDD family membrane protein YckC